MAYGPIAEPEQRRSSVCAVIGGFAVLHNGAPHACTPSLPFPEAWS